MSICRCYNDRYNGIPSLSVRICLLVPPNLLSISRIMSSHRPPKGDFTDILLSRDCQFHFIPPPFFLLSYIFSNLFIIYQIFLFVSILEIFYDMLNQTHILWVTFSIDNQFSIQILCHQTLFYMEQWDDLLYSLVFHLVKYF